MNLSTEQLKLLAEFLGGSYEEKRGWGLFFRIQHLDLFKNEALFDKWLHSNDGQCALMDALFAGKSMSMDIDNEHQQDWVINIDSWGGPQCGGDGKTRAEALIAAVLQMLERKK